MACGPTGVPEHHTPTEWARVAREEEIEHHMGRTLWVRDCQGTECQWRQVTSVDPSDPEHPDREIVR